MLPLHSFQIQDEHCPYRQDELVLANTERGTYIGR